MPEDFVKYIAKEKCDIYYFVTADVTVKERLENFGYMVEQSKLMKAECEKYGLPCFETSYNREEIIKEFLHKYKIT